MIFFDQRLGPVSLDHGSFRTAITGSGSHLHFSTSVSQNVPVPIDNHSTRACQHFIEYRLPRSFFFDRFELQGIFGDKIQLFGEQDLEAPEWQVDGWGSMLVLEIDTEAGQRLIEVPFHARYWKPRVGGQPGKTQLVSPQLFTACHQEDAAFSDNPWESFTSKQKIIGESKRFRFIPNVGETQFEVTSALADGQPAELVMWITILCILCGFAVVMLRSLHIGKSAAAKISIPKAKTALN